jgi:hypothetical protein
MYNPTNFHKLIQSHSVLLVNKKEHSIATGIFIKYNELYFVLTVAHILIDTALENILINFGIPGQEYPVKKAQYWKDDYLDLAFMKLNSFEAEIFQYKIQPFIIHNKLLGDFSTRLLKCAISGYPISLAYKKNSNKIIGETFLITTPLSLLPERWPKAIIENGKNPKDNFLLKYGHKHAREILYSNEERKTLIDPKGLSGSGIWIFDPNSENDEQPKYVLFGIQTGFYESSQLLAGTKVDLLFKQIESEYGEIIN